MEDFEKHDLNPNAEERINKLINYFFNFIFR